MGNRYHLKLYVVSTASNVRTHVRGRLVPSKALRELIEREAPRLLRVFEERKHPWMASGKHPTIMSLEEAASRMIYDVAPVLAIARESGQPAKCTLYFGDPTITNAYKKGYINKWKQNGFTRRSGAQVLEHGLLWGNLYRLVEELKSEVCYTPFDDPVMQKYHDDLKVEYRSIVKKLKQKWSDT